MTVVWNGTLDRLGACESITGYIGGSSLNNTPPESSFTGNELYLLQVALGVKARQPRRSRSEAQRARQARDYNPDSRRNRGKQ